MGISSDMVNLADSISAGHNGRKKVTENRLQELQDLRSEVRDKLGSFEKQREQVKRELQKGRKDLLGRLRVADRDLKHSVKGMMDALRVDRKEKSVEQAKVLEEFHSALGDSVKRLMDAFGADNREKSVEQARMLQEFRSALSDSVKEMRDAFGADHREKSVEQAKMLQEFRSALSDSMDKLIDALGADRSERSAEQARTLQRFHSALSNSVEKMLHVFSADHQKMKKAQGESLAALMNELRQGSEALKKVRKGGSGDLVSRAGKVKKKKVEPAKVPLVAKQEETSVIKVERSAQTDQKEVEVALHDKERENKKSGDLGEQVLEYIINRPQGVRVGDMEKPLGANRMRLGVIAKKLYESNKVRKEGSLYLPL
ncbi:MAG: hypothetical protein MI702_03765 [Chlorobiales bacterium]|nr:hypothetical protein [Chlorobiales bacterium]